MCVILFANDKRPTEEMVEQAWKKNDHGGGVAARVKSKDGTKTFVWWKKGLSLEEMKHYCATLELPFVAHFRIASSGGVLDELCHPFPIRHNTPYELEGFEEEGKYVLFHNGDWKSNWSDHVLHVALMTYKDGVKLPPGKWSDSRAMAFLSSFYGMNYMDFIDQKGIAFGPDDYELFWGKDGWVDVDGILCSNDKFVVGKKYYGGVCRDQWCKATDGLLNGWCPKHRPLNGSPNTLPEAAPVDKLICTKCRALLGANAPHQPGCPDRHLGTASIENGQASCPECHAVSGIGRGHTATCSKITNPGAALPNPLSRADGKHCQKCKEWVVDGRDHLITCVDFLKGTTFDANAPAGGRYATPFMVLIVAEQLRRLGPMKGGISNNQMKRIKERLNMKFIRTKDMDLSSMVGPTLQKSSSSSSGDPRLGVVTKELMH